MIKKLIGTVALTMLISANANAASLSIMGPSDAIVGDSFTLQIFGDFEAGLFAGGITLGWDAGLVQLDTISFDLAVDDAFSCPGNPNCPPATANSAPIVWGQFTNPLIPADSTNVLMATLSFTAIGGSTEGAAIFSMVTNDNLTGGWFDFNFNPIDAPVFNDFSMDINSTVVPLPAAVWFMVGGLGTLLGFRRK